VNVKVSAPPMVAEFRVRFTCLDQDGDEQRTEEICEGAQDAHQRCEELLTYQERFELPLDAAVWWRPGAGEAWRRWGGEHR
jgi:hypothetical protein